jgi:hypothetical protein
MALWFYCFKPQGGGEFIESTLPCQEAINWVPISKWIGLSSCGREHEFVLCRVGYSRAAADKVNRELHVMMKGPDLYILKRIKAEHCDELSQQVICVWNPRYIGDVIEISSGRDQLSEAITLSELESNFQRRTQAKPETVVHLADRSAPWADYWQKAETRETA